ncbi:MAG: OmpA family protein, partial [Bacteroidales bacterium]
YFYSERTKSGNWSLPVNLGYPVSTTDDDKFISPLGKGDTVYYAHYERENPGEKSIYRLILRSEKPPQGISLRGTARLKDSNIELDSTIMVSLIDTVSGETIGTVQPDRETGKYEFLVPPGNYQLVYTSPGYETQIHHLSVNKDFHSRDVAVNTRLVPEEIAKGRYLFIQNIYFEFDDFSLSRDERLKLERISSFMHEYPELDFEVIGYTDTVGSKAYNYQLSGRRANSVAAYLFNKGITKERLLTKGIGEIMAISRDQYREIEDLNDPRYYRRVEIKILKSDLLTEIREEIEIPEYLRPRNALNYSVIVIKVEEKLPEDFFDRYDMEELRYIREQPVSDGFIYTLGSFAQKQRAVGLLGELREVGFDEARVVDQHELSDIVVGQDPDPGFFNRPEKITEIPFYTIQIFALKNPPNPSIFRGRNDILSFECLDGFIRYCIGKYQGYSKALTALPVIREEWYRDAFIQELSRLEKGLPPGWEEDQ